MRARPDALGPLLSINWTTSINSLWLSAAPRRPMAPDRPAACCGWPNLITSLVPFRHLLGQSATPCLACMSESRSYKHVTTRIFSQQCYYTQRWRSRPKVEHCRWPNLNEITNCTTWYTRRLSYRLTSANLQRMSVCSKNHFPKFYMGNFRNNHLQKNRNFRLFIVHSSLECNLQGVPEKMHAEKSVRSLIKSNSFYRSIVNTIWYAQRLKSLCRNVVNIQQELLCYVQQNLKKISFLFCKIVVPLIWWKKYMMDSLQISWRIWQWKILKIGLYLFSKNECIIMAQLFLLSVYICCCTLYIQCVPKKVTPK